MQIFHHIHVVQRIQKSTEIWSVHVDVLQSTAQKKNAIRAVRPIFSSLSQSGYYCFLPLSLPGRSRLIFSTPKKTHKGDISTSYSLIQYSLLVYFRSLGTERLPKGKKSPDTAQRFHLFHFFVFVMSHALIGF